MALVNPVGQQSVVQQHALILGVPVWSIHPFNGWSDINCAVKVFFFICMVGFGDLSPLGPHVWT